MATTAGASTPPSPLPSTADTLWAHLLYHRGPSKANATERLNHNQLTPQDRAGTSTRILLHDTHARLEKFSECANSIFSEVEASRREIVRVREEVENAREKELETIAQLRMSSFERIYACYLNRCQSSLQKTIGEPAQARETAAMQACLAVTTERLRTLEEKINSKVDAVTTREDTESFCTQLVQAQTQLSQSLQEQFSRAQTQQSRILELLAPLHSILQSVSLHIDIARNAILEKIPERCGCRGNTADNGSSTSIPSAVPSNRTPLSAEDDAGQLLPRKRRKVSLDAPHSDPSNPSARGYEGQLIAVEERQATSGFSLRPGETAGPTRPQRNAAVSAVQTPNGKSGNDAVSRSHLGNARSGCGNDKPIISYMPSRAPAAAIPGKRFILFNDDDDDDDEP
ncbi:hypothetical protein F5148DRAFT_1147636 [Russula earlei]|uniref:Uncharacterized protein n=1 Tax=Russula earlei TaxID=71964 RepID=A0ACC0UFL4_9AGAM|nr:hypothetical protein F5148DRAFT_1147636 [Russula earlei]